MAYCAPSRPAALVIDDDAESRDFTEQMARSAGFKPESSPSGPEVVAALQALNPSVVLLNMQVSGTDSIDIMRGMAEAQCAAKLVIFGGMDQRILQVSAEIARQRGLTVVAALAKSAAPDDLRQILDRLSVEFSPFDERRLRHCLENDEIVLHYQPKIALPTQQVIGVEALLRCTDSAGRAVSPEIVLAVAEECGCVDALSFAVFAKSIAQYRSWHEQGLDIGIAINLSARGAVNQSLPEQLQDLCKASDVPPEALTIELTETAVMDDNLLAMETLVRLRLRGFDLSIDDFGTGHSSLVRLQQLPFSEVKIDKSFVIGRQKSPDNEVIIRTITQLAANLEMKCVIEGVEDEETLNFAIELGCTAAQGYFVAQALAPDRLPPFVKEWDARQSWRRSLAEREGGLPAEDVPVVIQTIAS